jgi:hypothetical protein
MNTGIMLMIAGAGANLVDAVTAKDASGGVLFGSDGALKAINDRLPLNMGLMVILIGLAIWVWPKIR